MFVSLDIYVIIFSFFFIYLFSLTNNTFERKARLMFSSIHQTCLFLYCMTCKIQSPSLPYPPTPPESWGSCPLSSQHSHSCSQGLCPSSTSISSPPISLIKFHASQSASCSSSPITPRYVHFLYMLCCFVLMKLLYVQEMFSCETLLT